MVVVLAEVLYVSGFQHRIQRSKDDRLLHRWQDLAVYSAKNLQKELGEVDDARHAYEQAIEIGAGTVGDAELQAWRDKLAELGEGGQ